MSSLKDDERAGKGREVVVSELLAKRVAKLSLEKKCEGRIIAIQMFQTGIIRWLADWMIKTSIFKILKLAV